MLKRIYRVNSRVKGMGVGHTHPTALEKDLVVFICFQDLRGKETWRIVSANLAGQCARSTFPNLTGQIFWMST